MVLIPTAPAKLMHPSLLFFVLIVLWSPVTHAQQCPVVPDVPQPSRLRVVVHVVSLSHVCARALNGTETTLYYGADAFQFHRQGADRWERIPSGTRHPGWLSSLLTGDVIERVLPYGNTAGPGEYRVCFHYAEPGEGKHERKVCSAPFQR